MFSSRIAFSATASALVISAALATSAFAVQEQQKAEAAKAGATPPPSVLVWNQKIEGGNVLVKYAHLPKNGYIVIYGADAAGKPSGDPIGSIALNAGDHRDIKVPLQSTPAAGTKLLTALHEDVDGDSKFDKAKDVALWSMDKLPSDGQFVVN